MVCEQPTLLDWFEQVEVTTVAVKRGPGRPRKSIDELIRNGTYRPSRHGEAARSIVKKSKEINGECRICMKQMTLSGWGGRATGICSSECEQLARCTQKQCVICNEPYFSPPNSGTTCSKPCTRRLTRQRSGKVALFCQLCNKIYTVDAIQLNSRFCSMKCRERVRLQMRRSYLNAWQRVRSAKVKTATVDKFSPLDVYQRDNWTCYICSNPVDRNQTHPEPLAPTVDHVIPISKGGEHSLNNCRCAHAICNMRKTDKLLSQ